MDVLKIKDWLKNKNAQFAIYSIGPLGKPVIVRRLKDNLQFGLGPANITENGGIYFTEFHEDMIHATILIFGIIPGKEGLQEISKTKIQINSLNEIYSFQHMLQMIKEKHLGKRAIILGKE